MTIGAQVIIPRRNFLVRALGLTAAGATMNLPIVTVADAKARMQHHIDGLQAAMGDYYGGTHISFKSNWQDPELVLAGHSSGIYMFFADEPGRFASMYPEAKTVWNTCNGVDIGRRGI
jgi:hypothetical protein